MLSQKNLDAIPHELRELKQWVCWRAVANPDDPERPKKLPVDPHPQNGVLRAGKSNDPSTWGYLPTAVATAIKYDLAGIGFVFTPNDPFVGIDLDYCLDPETKELRPWAKQVVDALASYTEISPSGRGVKVIARGKKPGTACKLAPIPNEHPRSELALYDAGRYFVVTGEVLNGSAEIREAQTVVDMVYERIARNGPGASDTDTDSDALPSARDGATSTAVAPRIRVVPDEELIRKIAASTSGEKFLRLWAGNVTGYPSESEADAALCAILAYWCAKDPVRIERIFGRSALSRREKWQREDYRKRTIASACELTQKVWTPDAGRWATWQDAFHTVDELPQGEISFLIDQIMPEGITFTGALSGIGKTWFALSTVRALITATKFLGIWNVPEPVNVLYLCPEMNAKAFRRRCERLGVKGPRFRCQTIADGPPMNLNDPLLARAIEELRPAVYLDTAIRFSEAEEENSATQNAQGLARGVFRIIHLGARAVFCNHHRAKGTAKIEEMTLENVLRGTGDFGAITDAVFGMQYDRGNGSKAYAKESRDLVRLDIRCVKARDFKPVADFRVQLNPFIDQIGNMGILTPQDFDAHDQAECDRVAETIRKNPRQSQRQTAVLSDVKRHRVVSIAAQVGFVFDAEKKIWTPR